MGCEYCGRYDHVSNAKTCEGCGAPLLTAGARPLVAYDPLAFTAEGLDALLRGEPGAMIPVDIRDYRFRLYLSHHLQNFSAFIKNVDRCADPARK